MNLVAEEFTGWNKEAAIGKPFTEVFNITNEITGEKAKDPVEEVLTTDEICQLENHTILWSKDGGERHIADSAAPIRDQKGKTSGVVMIFRDVTEKKNFQKQLLASEEHYRMLFNSMLNGYALHEIILNDDGSPCDYKFIDMNPAFEVMTGLNKCECIGNTVKEIFPETESYWIETYGQVVLTGEPMKIQNYSKAIDKYFEVFAFRPIANHFATLILDITHSKKKEEEILYLNYHDILTGLYNRTFFEQEIRRLDKERLWPFSIIIGDINGLKLINNAFGQEAGDKLLVNTAKIFSSVCRKEDIIARIGEDDFCILLPQTSCEGAETMLNQIKKVFEESVNNGTYYASIAFGHGTKTDHSESFDSIFKAAEELMYKSKLLERSSLRSSVINSIKTTMLEKSHETEEHAERLVDLSKKLGEFLSLTGEQLNELEILAVLHDIGKISINDHILDKPGKLTEEEWDQMKKHPEIGCRISQASPELKSIADYILCHHERWDGTGYPQGLEGVAIPLLSRIIAIVDAYDAMTQDRPYRKGMSNEKAIAEIINNAGTQFDPIIARVFVEKILGISWEGVATCHHI